MVDLLYKRVGTTLSAIEKAAYDRRQYDAVLDLLERRIAGQRLAVRKALTHALQLKLRRKGATGTHAALLLQLARSRNGSLRLVTTNFDTCGEAQHAAVHCACNTNVRHSQEQPVERAGVSPRSVSCSATTWCAS